MATTPADLLLKLKFQFQDPAPGYLDYLTRVSIGSLPEHAAQESHVIRIIPSDVITNPKTWPTEAIFVAILMGSVRCPHPAKAYCDAGAKTVCDLFEDIRLTLHFDPTLHGHADSLFISSGKFDIKKHSWGRRERLDQCPLYEVEVYVSIGYTTVLPP